MAEGRTARVMLVLLVTAEVGAVIALHRLGGVDGFAIPLHDLGRWLRHTPSEDVLLATVRLGALAAAWWLLGSTLLYVGARVARLRRTAHALGWATLPAVRRWADRAAAVSVVAVSALGAARPAGADPSPTTPVPTPVVIDVDHRDHRPFADFPPATTAPSPRTVPVVPVVPFPPAVPLPPRPEATHTVAPGEHLWAIAAATVAARTGRAVDVLSPADIAPFWIRLVERNRSRVRSGNPSLVYAGEILELPPL
jgi:hypothetical protein